MFMKPTVALNISNLYANFLKRNAFLFLSIKVDIW